MEVVFLINGSTVLAEYIIMEDSESDDGTACCSFSALVKYLPRGRHKLETQVSFAKPTDDGWNTYPAGTHYYRYTVTVKR